MKTFLDETTSTCRAADDNRDASPQDIPSSSVLTPEAQEATAAIARGMPEASQTRPGERTCV